MTRVLVRRLLTLAPVLLLISAAVFVTLRVLPGDAAQAIVGPDAPQEEADELRTRLGWDRPLSVQYVSWIADASRGDLGTSVRTRTAVSDLILSRLAVTFELTFAALLLATIVGIPLGVLAGSRAGRLSDQLATATAVAAAAVPSFWLGLMLSLLFAVKLGWLPPLGWQTFTADPLKNIEFLVLPTVTLGLPQAAILMRMTRAAVLDVLANDYIRTARAKGLAPRAVLTRHALRNALIPVVTIIGLQVSFLAGGAVIVEQVFAVPGIGKLLVDSILARDLPVVQALALLLAVCVATTSLCVDIAYSYLDPRVRLG